MTPLESSSSRDSSPKIQHLSRQRMESTTVDPREISRVGTSRVEKV